jgi:hypothetical protein
VINLEKNEERKFTPEWQKEEMEENERKRKEQEHRELQAERVKRNNERTSPPSPSEDIIYVKRSESKRHIMDKKGDEVQVPVPVHRPVPVPVQAQNVAANAGPRQGRIRRAVSSIMNFFRGRRGGKKTRKNRKGQ